MAADLKEILGVMRNKSPEARRLVERAWEYVQEKHKDQKRLSGDPYIVHLAATSYRIAQIGLDEHAVAAGLLHDTLEDTGVSREELVKEFGEEVTFLVEGVTKLGSVKYRGNKPHVESLRRLFVATGEDIRVILIKLFDRLHNMETNSFHEPARRKRKAIETLEVYAPIAERLGMGLLKRDLEDLSFPYAYPEEYERTLRLRREKRVENEDRLKKVHKSLKRALADAGITHFKTEIRIKGLFSLYKKLRRKGDNIDNIHDISAIRVIVPTVRDCYNVLAVIHGMWRPLPGKIKDYISFSKPNGYQSLHTTVFTGDGGAVEFQIRTEDMHLHAQFGVASHISYKEFGSNQAQAASRFDLPWIRDLIPSLLRSRSITSNGKGKSEAARDPLKEAPEWIKELAKAHEELEEPKELIKTLKRDFFSHRIFVFTPQGDVIDLPLGSSTIDFAYAVHTDIGNHISSAKVNGKMSSLGTKLRNGDIVEISTKPSAHPTRKWLEHVKTSLARRKITASIAKEEGR